VIVERADPREPEATALLHASHALMRSLFPPESNHYLSIEALRDSGVAFFVAREGGRTLGCAAMAAREGYGEVKSMFVAPEARGRGVGAALLARVEAEARARGLSLLRLETGDVLDAAHRVYERAGFARRGPFGDYTDDPRSLFMEKPLAAPAPGTGDA